MRKSLLFLITFVFIAFNSHAQFLDSIQAAVGRKGKFTFSFNTRNSYIGSGGANIFGFMAGVSFSRKFAIGGGYNTLNSYHAKSESIDGQTIVAELHFQYISYYAEYIFRIQNHWEIDIPVSIGWGSSSYSYNLNGAKVTQNYHFIMPVEPQIEVDYDFLKNKYGSYLFGFYIQVGYRYMLIKNYSIGENFNSTTYASGILLFPFEIYSAVFPRSKLTHLIEGN